MSEPNLAFVGAILTADVGPSALYAWYASSLQPHGWGATPDYRPSFESSGMAWQFHHSLQLQVGVVNPAILAKDQDISVSLGPGQSAYEEVLVGYPPGLPKD